MCQLRIGIAQINTTVGDFAGNLQKIARAIDEAKSLGVDLLTFPELAVCGYPPEDLLLKPQFIKENLATLNEVIKYSPGITLIVGFVDSQSDTYNAAAVIHHGKLVDIYHKICLPNYGVFDEVRYFSAGKKYPIYTINGGRVGINICEDIWYRSGPPTIQAISGAEIIVNISASPYHFGKGKFREEILQTRARDNVAIIVFNNLVGGQDELVFDGESMIISETGQTVVRGKQFEEDLIVADLDIDAVSQARRINRGWQRKKAHLEKKSLGVTRVVISEAPPVILKPPVSRPPAEELSLSAEVYNALVLGTRDYILKNGFEKVVIGLSGGIDSSLVAIIAVDAIGASNVIGVAMPSRYSSSDSKSDAELLAHNLGIKLMVIPIEPAFQAYLNMLAKAFTGTEPGITEENLQARVRGNLLMALSNKFGWLVLTTGNKSEMATGYTTLYGDMAGGFAVIKDVTKTMVYSLSQYRNLKANTALIPTSIIDKPPSAELKPHQQDSDTLPPYDQLDPVLTAYVEEDKGIEQIIDMGFNRKVVEKAARLVDRSEYKRRQSPPGVKITPRAFGRDWRLPITNRFKD
ncbi:MAG: NAD+ synthase [Dehalococcoidales bacterium]|nr:NAD+ synthase [Dehalococcoidales bacterium]